MRCSEKQFKPGSTFHIYNHVIEDYDLFYEDEDYNYLLNLFEDNLKKIPASIYAYCLMPNHYHFLIRQDSDVKIFKLFNNSFISYAKHFNHKYSRKDPIFRSPLQHIKVDNDLYILQLSKYIHLNPVRKELVDNPEDWEYSDYKRWIDNHFPFKIPFANLNKKLLPIKYTEFVNSCFNFLSYSEYLQLTSDKSLHI
jgi:putative transposase